MFRRAFEPRPAIDCAAAGAELCANRNVRRGPQTKPGLGARQYRLDPCGTDCRGPRCVDCRLVANVQRGLLCYRQHRRYLRGTRHPMTKLTTAHRSTCCQISRITQVEQNRPHELNYRHLVASRLPPCVTAKRRFGVTEAQGGSQMERRLSSPCQELSRNHGQGAHKP